MFEARLLQGSLLKKIIEAIRELVTDVNLECTETGISLQAMDSSHVSLCTVNMKMEGFDHYRWDYTYFFHAHYFNLFAIVKIGCNTFLFASHLYFLFILSFIKLLQWLQHILYNYTHYNSYFKWICFQPLPPYSFLYYPTDAIRILLWASTPLISEKS